MKDFFYTVKELSKFINVKPKTIYFWTTKRAIPFYRMESCVRFKKSEIDDWLSKCAVKNK